MLAQKEGARPTRRWSSRRADDGLLPARDRRAEGLRREGRQGARAARSAGDGRRHASLRTRSSKTGGSTSATTSSSTPAASASCSAAMRRCPWWRRRTRRIRSPSDFRVLTAYPLARSMTPERAVNTAARCSNQTRARAGPRPTSRPCRRARSSSTRTRATSRARSRWRRRRLGAGDGDAAGKPANAEPRAADAPKPERGWCRHGRLRLRRELALGIQGNQDLFLNSVNWLAQQENLIAIRPREPQDRRLTLTAISSSGSCILSDLRHPGLVFAGGVIPGGGGGKDARADVNDALVVVWRTGGLHLLRGLEDARRRRGAEPRDKVFTVEADKIDEIRVTSRARRPSSERRLAGWKITRRSQVDADANEVSGMTSNISSSVNREWTRTPSNLQLAAWPSRGSTSRSRPRGGRDRFAQLGEQDGRRQAISMPQKAGENGVPGLGFQERASTRSRSTCATRRSSSSTARRSTRSRCPRAPKRCQLRKDGSEWRS